MADLQPNRRQILKAGGTLALTPLVTQLFTAPASATSTTAARRQSLILAEHPALSTHAIWYTRPATDWQSGALPIGNARLGGMIFGDPGADRIQFNEQSLWGGVNNYDNALAGEPDSVFDTSISGFGSYRNFGEVVVSFAGQTTVSAPGGPYNTSPSETVDNTIDGNPRTKWTIDGPPATVTWQVKLSSALAVSSYSLTSANDVPERDPQQWTLSGSQDGGKWVALDTRTLPAPFESRFQTKEFESANSTAYLFYKFDFTPKAGVSHFQVADVALAGVNLGGNSKVYLSSPSGHSDGDGRGSDIIRSMDGASSTAWVAPQSKDGVVWQADLGTGVALTSYSLTSAAEVPAEDPQAWTLEGSVDGLSWSTLDTQSPDAPFAGRRERRTFELQGTAAHNLYRLTLHGGNGVNQLRVGEVALQGNGFDSRSASTVADYRRALDPDIGIHVVQHGTSGNRVLREAFASRNADVIVLRYETEDEAGLTGSIALTSAQAESPTTADEQQSTLSFTGTMANDLKHAATLRVIDTDGTLSADGAALKIEGARKITLVLDARTDYALDAEAGWRGPDPAPAIAQSISRASKRSYQDLREEHRKYIVGVMSRVAVEWGISPAEVAGVPTDLRLAAYGSGQRDPGLEQTMFTFGRYLLLSASRPGGLPANLQGLWNNSNQPPWGSDYHTNINVQMNYWAAETTNLPESHEPLIDFIRQVSVPSRVATRNAFGSDTRGWTARTSQSIFGGNGWQWNTVASAWYCQHVYEHWAFTQDLTYLREVAIPVIKEICQFWEDRLIEDEDGRLVSPNGWSPEHGPREDGVMYDQQIIWDLFQNYIDCEDAAKDDETYRDLIAGLQSRLAPNKIGSWGQLQEWQTDRDSPTDIHRHTSHLFAVFPGRQITTEKSPEFAAAALVSLKARCGERDGEPFSEATVSGDSRRSWTWPWRAALFARLGEPERAQFMIRGLLRYNTLANLYCDHPPFQMDGNFGITAAVAEMLIQSHGDVIHVLPALPKTWGDGSFSGLRARGGYEVNCTWRDGRVTEVSVIGVSARNQGTIMIRANGELHRIKPTKRGHKLKPLTP